MAKKRKSLFGPVPELVAVIALFFVVWTVGVTFYHLVEGLSFVDAFYFTAVTLTTVGYGDFAPQTDAGKVFTAIYAIIGIGIFLGFAAALFQSIANKLKR